MAVSASCFRCGAVSNCARFGCRLWLLFLLMQASDPQLQLQQGRQGLLSIGIVIISRRFDQLGREASNTQILRCCALVRGGKPAGASHRCWSRLQYARA